MHRAGVRQAGGQILSLCAGRAVMDHHLPASGGKAAGKGAPQEAAAAAVDAELALDKAFKTIAAGIYQ